ncbi:MAG: glutamate 5-kinase, partial [Clostridia bacterium]|nr:glutamate 5-kinase [Clostridia bacterium]
TGEDMHHADRYENFRNTLHRLLELGALPIINENDTVSTAEIAVGDNDTLGAIVAKGADAELLVLLTDIDGLYTADPRTNPDATLVAEVSEITPELLATAGGKGSALGTGGMATKLSAAAMCMKNGISTVIANGDDPELLYDILEGKPVGTLFRGR